eukprot:1376449-Rhodomonas_salina.1
MIRDGSYTVEPGHPEDDAHALQGKDAEGDVGLVLPVDLDGEGGLVQDGKRGTVGELHRAGRGDRDEGCPKRASDILAEELSMGAVVAETVNDHGARASRD